MYIVGFWLEIEHMIACSQDLLILTLHVEQGWCWNMSFRNAQFEVPILAFFEPVEILSALWSQIMYQNWSTYAWAWKISFFFFLASSTDWGGRHVWDKAKKTCRAHYCLLNYTYELDLWTEIMNKLCPVLLFRGFLWMSCIVYCFWLTFSLCSSSPDFDVTLLWSLSPCKWGFSSEWAHLFWDFFCSKWLGILTAKLPPLHTCICRPGLSSRMNEDEVVK